MLEDSPANVWVSGRIVEDDGSTAIAVAPLLANVGQNRSIGFSNGHLRIVIIQFSANQSQSVNEALGALRSRPRPGIRAPRIVIKPFEPVSRRVLIDYRRAAIAIAPS